MPVAFVAFDFDPVVRYGDNAVRLETLALAAAVLLSLILAAMIARRTRVPAVDEELGDRLRLDDLVLLVLSIIPGAVAGGRLGYALLHLDYYSSHPGAVLDPGQGSLELMSAVLGGVVTGSYAARLIGESVGSWLDVAAAPLVAGIATGKLAMALGGRGQGAPSDLPWATAYVGGGPWASLAPGIPSHPAQLYEAAGALIVLAAVIAWSVRRHRQEASTFLVALGGWAVARAAVAATWRDAPVVGPILAAQLLSLAVVIGCLVVAARLRLRRPGWLAERPARRAPQREPEPRSPG